MPNTRSVGQIQPVQYIHHALCVIVRFSRTIFAFYKSCLLHFWCNQWSSICLDAWITSSDSEGQIPEPLLSDGSQKTSFPYHTVNLGYLSQISAFSPLILSRPCISNPGYCCYQLQQSILQASSPCTMLTGKFHWKYSICSIAPTSLMKETFPPSPPKKKEKKEKNLSSYLKKEERNAEKESTNIKTQEAPF